MTTEEYLTAQPPERSVLLNEIHQIIIAQNPAISTSVATMMRTEMIQYCQSGTFKYGLASGKQYMSLHVFPMYCQPEIHERYKALLPGATFQKSCVNFNSPEQMPLDIVTRLIEDCAKIDVAAIMENYKNSKKAKK